MTMDVRIPRMALVVIRASLLEDDCKHPAEALEHSEVRCEFRCTVCEVRVGEETVARVAADPRAARSTYRSTPDQPDAFLLHTVAAGGPPLW